MFMHVCENATKLRFRKIKDEFLFSNQTAPEVFQWRENSFHQKCYSMYTLSLKTILAVLTRIEKTCFFVLNIKKSLSFWSFLWYPINGYMEYIKLGRMHILLFLTLSLLFSFQRRFGFQSLVRKLPINYLSVP